MEKRRNVCASDATLQYIGIMQETAGLKERFAELAKDDKYVDVDSMGIVIGNFCTTIESVADVLGLRICGRVSDGEELI